MEGDLTESPETNRGARILLLAFLDVLREPLQALEETLSRRRATVARSGLEAGCTILAVYVPWVNIP